MTKKLLSVFILLFVFSISTAQEATFPDMTVVDLDGNKVDLKALSAEGPVAISFWATWCGPCMLELNAINDVIEDWVEETGVKFFAISIDDSKTVNRVRPMVNGKGWDFNILLDTNNELKRQLNFSTPPYSLVVSDGKIVYKHLGYQPGAEDEFYENIKLHAK